MSVALAKVESWEDHVEAWHHHGREADNSMWGRAAIAASVKGRWGEVSKFAGEVGFHRAVVHDYANTFEAFPEVSLRNDTLTFYHHLIARRCTKNAEQARAALEQAALEGWSANALRVFLKPPAEIAESCDTEGGACGPVTGPDRLLHTLVILRDLYLVKDYEPDPILNSCKKKDLKDLHVKLTAVAEWVQSLQTAINRRLQ